MRTEPIMKVMHDFARDAYRVFVNSTNYSHIVNVTGKRLALGEDRYIKFPLRSTADPTVGGLVTEWGYIDGMELRTIINKGLGRNVTITCSDDLLPWGKSNMATAQPAVQVEGTESIEYHERMIENHEARIEELETPTLKTFKVSINYGYLSKDIQRFLTEALTTADAVDNVWDEIDDDFCSISVETTNTEIIS